MLGNHGQRRRDDHSCVEVADLMLYGRDLERSAITALLDGARAARGGVLFCGAGPARVSPYFSMMPLLLPRVCGYSARQVLSRSLSCRLPRCTSCSDLC